MARVNGEPVTKGEFEKFINQLEKNAAAPAPPDWRDEIFRMLDGLAINLEVASQEVKARGVTGDEQVVAEEIKKIRSRFQTEDEFTKALAAQMTADRLKMEMQTQLGINKLMEPEASGRPPVTDTDVKDFYDKNPERFKKLNRCVRATSSSRPRGTRRPRKRAGVGGIGPQTGQGQGFRRACQGAFVRR